jgi:beta-lactamase class D
MKRLLLLAFLLPFPVLALDTVILETVGHGPTRVVAGNPKLADVATPPASTFKIVIAWAALEEGVAEPSTAFKVADKHVPGAPRTVTLAEAMFFSSNDAFVELASRLPKGCIEKYVEQSGFTDGLPPKDWLKDDPSSVRRGGTLLVTPRQQHAFILRVMRGKVGSTKMKAEQLLECLAWPVKGSKTRLYGKTGTLTGVTWFNGFGIEEWTDRAVTVLCIGPEANRADTVAAFYARFGVLPPKLP